MSIFGEAWATLSGSGLVGQASIEELYRAVESGEVVAAEILPIVAEIMSERAQPKLGIMKRSSIAESARVVNEWNDLLTKFSESGGEEGFARFFRTLAEQLPRLTPLMQGFAGTFRMVSSAIEPTIGMFANYVQVISELKVAADEVHPSLSKFAAIIGLLALRMGRLFIAFSGVFLILEDISVGLAGGNSYTKNFLDFFEGMGEHEGKILGLAAALLTLVAAYKLLGRSSKNNKRLPDVVGKDGRDNRKGIPFLPLALNLPTLIATGIAYGVYKTGLPSTMWDVAQSRLSGPDRLLANIASMQGYKTVEDQSKYWNDLFSSTQGGYLTGRNLFEHLMSSSGGKNILNSYLRSNSLIAEDGSYIDLSPAQRRKALEDLAIEFNEAFSSSKYIRSDSYQGPLQVTPEDIARMQLGDYVNRLPNTNIHPTITNEININADGVVDPEGVRTLLEDMMPEIEANTERMFQNILSTTQDAYGG